MPDYLIKGNASKPKPQYLLSIKTFSLETTSTLRICNYSLKNLGYVI